MTDFTITDQTGPKPKTLDGTVNPGPFLSALQAPKRVILESAGTANNPPQTALWSVIRTRARWMAYPNFEAFVATLFSCQPAPNPANLVANLASASASTTVAQLRTQYGQDAYGLLKAAAEVFLAVLCNPGATTTQPPSGLDVSEPSTSSSNDRLKAEVISDEKIRNPNINWKGIHSFLSPASYPYLTQLQNRLSLSGLPSGLVDIPCDGIRESFCPLELIWSYWHEEGMLVQSINAICLRFQNKRSPHLRNPLLNCQLSAIHNLSNVFFTYLQDQPNQTTLAQRAYEYVHEYGLSLVGKAVSDIQSVDSRSNFLEAFHNLCLVACRFHKEVDDATLRADPFPLLNALKELHLILAQGAHNQAGDLPRVSRVEMLIQEWMLARPEIRDFLGGAPMVPYKETWMPHVDSMKTLQGWSDVSVSQFRDLGYYGEQILLSVRYEKWIDIDDPGHAYNWAVYWRAEIQSYIHSYRAVTGVDLSSELTDSRSAAARNVQPAIHQMRRLNQKRAGGNGSPGVRSGNGAVYSR